MKIELEGSDKKIKGLLKLNRLWIKRNNIKVVGLESEEEEAKEENPFSKYTGKEVVELIEATDSIDELKEFESDERQVVVNALKKRIKELS